VSLDIGKRKLIMPTITKKHRVGNNCNDCPHRMMDGLSPYCNLFPERDIEDSYKQCVEKRSYD
jgi:hypothetical protein